jgi:hypothetical protein
VTRDDRGRALYTALYRNMFVPGWDDLPDHRRERYRIVAEDFAAWLALHRVEIAA